MSDEELRFMLWRAKHQGRDFICAKCGSETFSTIESLPETRQCTKCRSQNRLRAGTIMEHSKLPLTLWMRAAERVIEDDRISAAQVKRDLAMARYETAWLLLFKLREALEVVVDPTPATVLTRSA
jgi:hypothetical protein